jgi:Leucine Rich repeat
MSSLVPTYNVLTLPDVSQTHILSFLEERDINAFRAIDRDRKSPEIRFLDQINILKNHMHPLRTLANSSGGLHALLLEKGRWIRYVEISWDERNYLKFCPGAEKIRIEGKKEAIIPHEDLKKILNLFPERGVKSLAFKKFLFDNKGMEILSNSEKLNNIKELTFNWCRLDQQKAVYLAGGMALKNLTYLNLKYNDLGPEGALALRTAIYVQNLVFIDLTFNYSKDEEWSI